MIRLLSKIFFASLFLTPIFAWAQMTSTNYQVEAPAISAFGRSTNATSTNYDLDLESGGLYIYDVLATSSPSSPSSGGGGSSKKNVTSQASASTSIIIGPKLAQAGDLVTIVLVVNDTSGQKLTTGGNTVVFAVTGSNTITPSTIDNQDGTYIVQYRALYTGSDKIVAFLNGKKVLRDSDGVSDGELNIPVNPKGNPAQPPGLVKNPDYSTNNNQSNSSNQNNVSTSTNLNNLSTTTGSGEDINNYVTEPFVFNYGVTTACYRAFVWNYDLAADVYRSVNDSVYVYVGSTVSFMPWFVDTEVIMEGQTYRIEYSNKTSSEVSFNKDNFASCTPDPTALIVSDIDNDGVAEQYVEGIFQDPNGNTRPLALAPDGLVLSTHNDNDPDLFWNPYLGTSEIINAGDRLFIVDSSVSPTQSYLPLESANYRIKLDPLPNGNVALLVEGADLIQLIEQVDFDPLEISKRHVRTFEYVGLAAGLLGAMMAIARIPFSATHFIRTFTQTVRQLFALVVFWRKRKPWGTVYDSKTKVPIDPAIVVLHDANGTVVDQAITDMDGRYGFLAPPGEYYISSKKTHYNFPSQFRTLSGNDTIYSNLYYGENFSSDNQIVRDIPMDAEAFDWNQLEKVRAKKLTYFRWFDPLFVVLLDVLFFFGALSMFWQFLTKPDWYSFVLLIIYLVLLAFRVLRGKPVIYGTIKKGGVPLPFAQIIVSLDGRVRSKKVADEFGRYFVLAPTETYEILVKELIAENQYADLEVKKVKARKGVINKTLKY